MAAYTINDVVSRVRNQVKAVKADAFVTDRFLFSLISKHSHWLMKREDGKSKIMKMASVMQTLDFVELIEVDKVAASCTGIKSGCTIKRTKEKLPNFMQGYYGPLIKNVSSLDGSESMQPTNSSTYTTVANSKNNKYNKTKYYWFSNDYLYFPNIEWDAVKIEGVFEDDISDYKCEDSNDGGDTKCKKKQDQLFNVPDYLHGEIESNVMKDLGLTIQIPSDVNSDKQSLLR
jgi:hypothetical protein